MKNSGFFWHVHHEVLLEWCYDYNERAEFIRTQKAKEEQEIRLRLFQPVKGDLPQEVIEALRTYDEALKKNMSAIETLHAAECPNCPWDGYTIFPK